MLNYIYLFDSLLEEVADCSGNVCLFFPACRGNATMRPTAKKQIIQEINISMPQDISGQLGPDAAAKLGPSKANKSNAKLRRLLRAFQVLSVVAAVNVPIYIMLLFSDWIDI